MANAEFLNLVIANPEIFWVDPDEDQPHLNGHEEDSSEQDIHNQDPSHAGQHAAHVSNGMKD